MLKLPRACGRVCQGQSGRCPIILPHNEGHSLLTSSARLCGVIARSQPEQRSPPKLVAPNEEELPPWIRREKERELQAQQGASGLPWPLYLLFSVFTAIAAVGSIFEFLDRNPIFGVLPPDNPLWAPILLLFAITGIPTSGFLFIKGVNGFNEEAERQDKLDGYL